jgi:hypothetical protein
MEKDSVTWLGISTREKVKLDSRYVRFVIAKHSPERVLKTGLLMEAPEKNRCNRSDTAERLLSLSASVGEYRENSALVAYSTGNVTKFLCSIRLHGGGK